LFLQEEELHEAVGSKWTLTAFRRFLRESGIDDAALWTRIEGELLLVFSFLLFFSFFSPSPSFLRSFRRPLAGCVARALLAIEGVCGTAGQEWAAHRDSCFELFGFDVLVDDALRPWVLEVNLSPSLSVESNLDFGVKTEM
jgi:hypothetical protein